MIVEFGTLIQVDDDRRRVLRRIIGDDLDRKAELTMINNYLVIRYFDETALDGVSPVEVTS